MPDFRLVVERGRLVRSQVVIWWPRMRFVDDMVHTRIEALLSASYRQSFNDGDIC